MDNLTLKQMEELYQNAMKVKFRRKYYRICCEYFREFIVALKIPAWCKYCYACGAKIETIK